MNCILSINELSHVVEDTLLKLNVTQMLDGVNTIFQLKLQNHRNNTKQY